MFEPRIYVGKIARLKDKRALVRDSGKPGVLLAQFDDIKIGTEAFGWHEFKIEDFEEDGKSACPDLGNWPR